jgi:hypothetical protein
LRLLLIAYEFPPSPSPQSLRWSYLASELVRLGHEVHVLTIDLGGSGAGLPQLPAGVRVHRTYAGPVRGLMAAVRKRKARNAAAHGKTLQPAATRPVRVHGANWKKQAWDRLQEIAALVVFPDVRGEWYPWARREMNRLLRDVRPDVAISSHEPATTLQLGLLCKARGVPWLADLGDPVLAPYTPRQWRRKARRLEADVCTAADHILVTNSGAASLLAQRHGRNNGVSVLTQGYDGRRSASLPTGSVAFDPDRLELLYTGSFYRFRRASALLKAVAELPGVRLNIAAVTLPAEIVEAARLLPDQFRLLGFVPHLEVLQLQSRADVLVNIANDEATQIPGKIYEYLGARRPIVHLSDDPDDTIGKLLRESSRGVSCANEAVSIAACLGTLLQAKTKGPVQSWHVDSEAVLACSWESLAKQLDALLHDIEASARARQAAQPPPD